MVDFVLRLHEQNASRGKRWHPSGLVSWSLALISFKRRARSSTVSRSDFNA